MKFKDYTIALGRIHSERLQDTSALAPPAIKVCSQMLQTLRRGALKVGNPQQNPPFSVTLGLPDEFVSNSGESILAPGRFFCVWAPNTEFPILINLVIPRENDEGLREDAEDPDQRAIGTILGLSGALHGATMDEANGSAMMADLERMWNERPFVAAIPTGAVFNPALQSLVADFSTCFAAAMFKEWRCF